MTLRIIATAALIGGLAGGFVAFAERVSKLETNIAREGDGVVVLTGGADRIAVGAQLVGPEHKRRLLVSGVNEKTTPEDMLSRNPQLRPIVSCCLDLGYRARNTIGNALEARDWAQHNGYRSLVLVTGAPHMPRALAEFANAMPQVKIAPHAVGGDRVDASAWWSDMNLSRTLAYEYAKYLVAAARMRLEPEPGAWFPGSIRDADATPAARR
ncbi:YdcF family protein [Terrarubrum flagellatum]|uniref:YdcF family protein n=1 Tax=Terrirubrum flagellatum TaxID=2895980 RepID=UPI0031452CFF